MQAPIILNSITEGTFAVDVITLLFPINAYIVKIILYYTCIYNFQNIN